ncbi:MAG: PrpF domain-containing protein, partial [Saprospiraceae bacterium]
LSGVLPYAIESGLIKATHPTTTATIHMLNSGGLCEVTVQTPNGKLTHKGNAKVDGVLGTGAPIICNYLDIAGANCGALLPTGKAIDIIDGIEVSCVDNGMPVVNIRATDLGISGYESKAELDADEDLKKDLESIRIQAGRLMNLGDVSQKTVPKMSLISPPKNGGLVNTRTFIPHVCHAAIGVLGAVSAATGCLIPGSVAEVFANVPDDFSALSVEHPSGQFSVSLEAEFHGKELVIGKSGTLRTARIISKGEVYIPNLV